MNKEETIILIIVIAIVLFIILPPFMTSSCNKSENFSGLQSMEGTENTDANKVNAMIEGTDTDAPEQRLVHPRGSNKDYESLIFDNTTGTIMTGSQFMENTGIIAPPWIAPAWDPDAYGPSSKGELDPADYENDPRMLYNKCSLSCCSAQYPTPFQGTVDPFVCDKDGKNKYLASDYICQNNTGGTGCLCMTPKQVDGMSRGFVDYYADKNLGY